MTIITPHVGGRQESLRTGGRLDAQLRARAGERSLAATLKADAQRYYRMLEWELERLDIPEHDALLLWLGLRDTHWLDLQTERELPLARSTLNELARVVWGTLQPVDPEDVRAVQRLSNWLLSLRPAQRLALIDAIERARALDETTPLADRLRTVGLLRKED